MQGVVAVKRLGATFSCMFADDPGVGFGHAAVGVGLYIAAGVAVGADDIQAHGVAQVAHVVAFVRQAVRRYGAIAVGVAAVVPGRQVLFAEPFATVGRHPVGAGRQVDDLVALVLIGAHGLRRIVVGRGRLHPDVVGIGFEVVDRQGAVDIEEYRFAAAFDHGQPAVHGRAIAFHHHANPVIAGRARGQRSEE